MREHVNSRTFYVNLMVNHELKGSVGKELQSKKADNWMRLRYTTGRRRRTLYDVLRRTVYIVDSSLCVSVDSAGRCVVATNN